MSKNIKMKSNPLYYKYIQIGESLEQENIVWRSFEIAIDHFTQMSTSRRSRGVSETDLYSKYLSPAVQTYYKSPHRSSGQSINFSSSVTKGRENDIENTTSVSYKDDTGGVSPILKNEKNDDTSSECINFNTPTKISVTISKDESDLNETRVSNANKWKRFLRYYKMFKLLEYKKTFLFLKLWRYTLGKHVTDEACLERLFSIDPQKLAAFEEEAINEVSRQRE